jgi:phage terminase Nu1 subunit (DNA packaging protein)
VLTRSGKNRFPLTAVTDFIKWSSESKKQKKSNFSELLEQEKHRKIKRENDIEDQLVAPVSLLTDAIHKAANQIIPILETMPLEMKRHYPEITGDQITMVKTAIANCRNAIADMDIEL